MSSNPFTSQLMLWHDDYARDLPWKKNQDPYSIWLSEIILQQTRVEQGLPYYNKFIDAFPDVHALASASEDEVLKLWEGLGYYSRARNLHYTAQVIAGEMDGNFPDSYEGLLKLKGVGPYTAAAIASFAYNLPQAVVDGNVIRVISRYVGIEEPVDVSSTKKDISRLAHQFLDQKNPGAFNQAMMDFGALQCVPSNPDCEQCPLNDSCYAFANDLVNQLPFKKKAIVKKSITMDYHILFDESHVLIKKRTQSGIWKGLHDFLIGASISEPHQSVEMLWPAGSVLEAAYQQSLGPYTHILTHRKITAHFHFHRVTFSGVPTTVKPPFYLVERKKLSNFAFPVLIKKHIIDRGLLNNAK